MFAKKSAAIVAAGLALASLTAHADVTIRLFAGGSGQRPDLVRKALDNYEKANPGVKVVTETGGATSEQQRQYLSTLLNAKDASLDVFMIDIVNPAQYLTAGWIAPLDPYLGPASSVMKAYLPVYAKADVVDGKIAALPAFADGMFVYYRKDLLDKYGAPQPKTWADLATAAKTIMAKEHNPALQGLSIQGAPAEGAVCTFLLPYWSQRKELTDVSGRLTLDKNAAVAGMNMWTGLMDQGVIKRNVAEVKTADTVNEFKAGHAIYAVNWGFAWNHFETDTDSTVKGKVGVMPLPAMAGGDSTTCVGGWQWAVSAFSTHKPEAAKLIRYLSSPEVAKMLAVKGSLLPVFPGTYQDPDVLAQNPWFKSAGDILTKTGRARPVTPRYSEVSDTIRTTTSAMLGRSVPVTDGVDQIEGRLRRILR
ncbi:ABC transporter substrate-binding protein [Burkholderia multivorans]|uniref:ABC transporter substrate-binding protein n=1 Tax=Burkholderia multivorans TaxID=87883 RepID=UPI0019D22843|nr:ABC transporter substrate-binding protein [Burkholderia multivorans]MBN6738828.1 ABC transporter substrate-binding protein [Burkholderia multivorans]MBN7130101.1 ABC transporter substrate-binding protein [Burkholderia multivorans]MBN8173458.1 ABC transporter substrate-binding protein [Burkholderia multivorans]QSL29418.1 ABC transporter substrate-binding protein [Burkholderia multivorans]